MSRIIDQLEHRNLGGTTSGQPTQKARLTATAKDAWSKRGNLLKKARHWHIGLALPV